MTFFFRRPRWIWN